MKLKKNKSFGNRTSKGKINYIYGRIPVLTYLSKGQANQIYLQEGFNDRKILDALASYDIAPIFVDRGKMNSFVDGANHQGIVASIDSFVTYSLTDIISDLKGKKNPHIVMLEDIVDPHNLGAIIRNMDAFGFEALIIKNNHQAPLSSTVYKVSTGALSYIKVAIVSNLVNAINTLKKEGYWIYSTALLDSSSLYDTKFDSPSVLIFGNEEKGISRLVRENSDFIIKIPMHGHVDSLNVASSSAIILSYIKNKS